MEDNCKDMRLQRWCGQFAGADVSLAAWAGWLALNSWVSTGPGRGAAVSCSTHTVHKHWTALTLSLICEQSLKEMLQRHWEEYHPITAFIQWKRPVGQEQFFFMTDRVNTILLPPWDSQYRKKNSKILISSRFQICASRNFHFLKFFNL